MPAVENQRMAEQDELDKTYNARGNIERSVEPRTISWTTAEVM